MLGDERIEECRDEVVDLDDELIEDKETDEDNEDELDRLETDSSRDSPCCIVDVFFRL